jgi:hypothetical protein
MTINVKATHRTLASLKLPTKIPALTSYAQGIVKAMTNNPEFTNPIPSLATMTAAIDDFQAAETAALSRAKGAAATRNAKRTALVQLLQQLKTYVQTVADANLDKGPAVVQGAGMAVRKTPVHAARVFALKEGPVSGSVKVHAAAAARRASYDWEYSADGGKTWVATPSTLQAKTTVSGLPAGTTVQFRYRAVTKTGQGDWSQPLSMLVK